MPLIENGPGTVVLGAEDRVAALAGVKARLRVAASDEDALVVAFAETALGLAEQVTGQVTIVRALVQPLVGDGGWQRLHARPVRAITAVTMPDGGAVEHAIDIDGAGTGWVRVAAGQAVSVRYAAGLASGWDTLPAGLREGAAMLAAHLFDDRTGAQPVPAAVTALWRPFRDLKLLERAR